jgi:hypothetical protein
VGLTTLPPHMSRLSRLDNVGSSASHNPIGLHGLIASLFALTSLPCLRSLHLYEICNCLLDPPLRCDVMTWGTCQVPGGLRPQMSLCTAAARIADLWSPLRWSPPLCFQTSQHRTTPTAVLTRRRRSLSRHCVRQVGERDG